LASIADAIAASEHTRARRRHRLHPAGVTSSQRVLDVTQAAHARKIFCRWRLDGRAGVGGEADGEDERRDVIVHEGEEGARRGWWVVDVS
jgi:hypothetical protein